MSPSLPEPQLGFYDVTTGQEQGCSRLLGRIKKEIS